MRDDVQAGRVDAIGIGQQGCRRSRHDHSGVDLAHQLDDDRALVRRRLSEDGVQGRDRGDVQRPGEVQDRRAVLAAPDAVLVLDGHDIDAVSQRSGDTEVVGGLVATDPVMDLGRVSKHVCRRMQRDDLAGTSDPAQVSGEGGDAAAAGRVGGDECGPDDGVLRSMAAPGSSGGGRRLAICDVRIASACSPSGSRTARPGTGRSVQSDLEGQAARTCPARGPLGLVSISNVTRSPPFRRSKSSEESSEFRWKKYSFVSSAAMKPKPRSATTFLMVPVVHDDLQRFTNKGTAERTVRSRRGVDHAEHRHERRRSTDYSTDVRWCIDQLSSRRRVSRVGRRPWSVVARSGVARSLRVRGAR